MAIVIGLLIGLALGLTGAGGSLVAVPLLILLLNVSPQEATTLSLLGVFLGAFTGLVSSVVKSSYRQDILLAPAVLMLVLGAIFAPLGRWLALYLSDSFLVLSFALLAFIIAAYMWFRASADHASGHSVRAQTVESNNSDAQWVCPLSDDRQFQWRPKCVLFLMVGAAGVGLLSGVYGVGGGFLIVPLLLLLTRVSMAVAVKSSLFVIAGVSAAGLVSGLHLSVSINFLQLFQIGLGSVGGMLAASVLGSKLNPQLLQKLFSLIVVGLSVSTLIDYF